MVIIRNSKRYGNEKPMLKDYPFIEAELQRIRNNIEPTIQIQIANSCNLMCSYCVSNMNLLGTPIYPYAQSTMVDAMGPELYFDILYEKLKDMSSFTITPGGSGEAILSPHFSYFIDRTLPLNCRYRIYTNFHDISPILDVFTKFNREDIKRRFSFSGSYHLGTYLERNMDREFYFENLSKMLEYGFPIQLNTPLTPEILQQKEVYLQDWIRLKSMERYPDQLTNGALELYHVYKGKSFPSSYTKEEWETVKSILLEVNSSHNFAQKVESPSVLENLNLFGAKCLLPSKFCLVRPDGRIMRCDSIVTNDFFFCPSVLLFEKEDFICSEKLCCCRSQGIEYCLRPHGLSIGDYEKIIKQEKENDEAIRKMES